MPKYLHEIYYEYLDPDSANLINSKDPIVVQGENLTNLSLIAINHSDVITAQINACKYCCLFLHSRLMSIVSDSRKWGNDPGEQYFWFDMNQDNDVLSSEFRIYREEKSAVSGIKLKLYKIVDVKPKMSYKFISQRIIYKQTQGWIMLNVTQAVMDWVRLPDTNYGLYLEILDSRGSE